MSEFKVGDQVTWQVMRGNVAISKPLSGKIIAIVPAYTSYLAALTHHVGQAYKLTAGDIRKTFSFKYLGRAGQRDHVSYLVVGPVDGKRPAIFWPQLKSLKKVENV